MIMLESLAYLAEIIGVSVVVATLIYLAAQVKQGKELLLSEARQGQVNNDQNNIYKFIEHPQLAHATSTTERLDPDEKVRLAFFIIASMRAREHEYFQYKAGVLDEVTWKSYRNVIIFVLGSDRARSIWSICAPFYDSDYVEMVDQLISSVPLIRFWKELDAIP
jgi:hypothetical protein